MRRRKKPLAPGDAIELELLPYLASREKRGFPDFIKGAPSTPGTAGQPRKELTTDEKRKGARSTRESGAQNRAAVLAAIAKVANQTNGRSNGWSDSRLAEYIMARVSEYFPGGKAPWTILTLKRVLGKIR